MPVFIGKVISRGELDFLRISQVFSANFQVLAAFLRDRPRGLGLLQLPTGMTDERSAPFFPNLYMAGDKVRRPRSWAEAGICTRCASSWSVGRVHWAVKTEIYLGCGRSLGHLDLPILGVNELFDLDGRLMLKGHLDLPILGVNELFDLDGRLMLKGGGNGILNSALEFPLTLSDPNERAPYTFKYLNYMADRHMQYGHVVPNVNLFLVGKDKIMDPPFIRDRPRGLGLLQLPTGMTDERSGPFFPNLYIAGDKLNFNLIGGYQCNFLLNVQAGEKPMSVPDVHLPGQKADFSGRSAFNPFTHAVAAVFNEDLVDSWGTGFAVNGVNNHDLQVRRNFDQLADIALDRNDGMHQPSAFNPFTHAVAAVFNEDLVDSWGTGFAVNGVNNHDLQVRRNFDQFADIALDRNDGMHQPFLTAFSVGSEYDMSKIKEISGHLDLPIPGVNEMFDFDGRLMVKGKCNNGTEAWFYAVEKSIFRKINF
ncbi:unnamed protein product [Strongylus vulgaris]|uniref:Uncharacterized protein n=1 Tax=Strongylus vulgaris TaxID=40348 RepID=A0A3P7LCA5_STRVU|nr:unnamed protein product [Strongylus vulgaris]